ncbi:hypothetical protein B0H21DRAFT_827386 [Amylocystis lapponica]|nr:hypothetical protein B0H21DRAFT_827386 [Amylocystis lapponica]
MSLPMLSTICVMCARNTGTAAQPTPTLVHLSLFNCYEPLRLPADVLPALASFRGSAITVACMLPARPVPALAAVLVGHDFVTAADLARADPLARPRRDECHAATATRHLAPPPRCHRPPRPPRAPPHTALCALGHHECVCPLRTPPAQVALLLALLPAPAASCYPSPPAPAPSAPKSMLAGLTPVLGAFPELHQLDLSPTVVDQIAQDNALCTTWARSCVRLRHVVFPSKTEWTLSPEQISVAEHVHQRVYGDAVTHCC